MALKWWEKTIEYKFIILCAKEKVLKFAPLDGEEEIAGDNFISNNNNKWIIIEFKKDKNSINTETYKFEDFKKAEQALINEDQHHFIVYGGINKKSNKLDLYCQTYFSKNKLTKIKDMLNSGKDISEFKNYVRKFILYKKSNKGATSSGNGKLNVENYAMVAAIDSNGNIEECQSFNEFVMNEELDIAINNDYDEPSIDYRNLN